MNEQDQINHNRIAEAIGFIRQHYPEQPDLDTVAGAIGVSPFHFQRLFTQWAGISPKKFLQYTSLQHARYLLKEKKASVFDTACQVGLSGTGRLHDLFVRIEGMTPGEYKNGGRALALRYRFEPTCFGPVLVASTGKGVCYMAFADDRDGALNELKRLFPNAGYIEQPDEWQHRALSLFSTGHVANGDIRLHLKGTPFQLKVWEMLLQIPDGRVSTYGDLAAGIGSPKACRAVGTAVGDNPVACLIPCHRVIRSTGELGGYRWGVSRKSVLLAWESARQNR